MLHHTPLIKSDMYVCMYIYFLFIVLFVIREGILEVRGNILVESQFRIQILLVKWKIISSGVESLFLL